jgi:peroxiredoxin Q/BCP
MTVKLIWLALLSMAFAFSTFSGNTMAKELNVGDDAPEFELKGSDGETYQLADFKDKQVVVIAWFPKAFTGG